MTTWTAPATFTNSTLNATQMNTEVRDHMVFLKGALDLLTASTTADTGSSTYIAIERTAGTDTAYQSLIPADTQPRWTMDANGKMNWGPGGSTATDTILQRAAASTLKTDTSFWALQGVRTYAKSGTPVDGDFAIGFVGDGILVIDTSTNKLWARTGGGFWKSIQLV